MPEEQKAILIVDDEAPIRSALRRIVAREGFFPIEARGANEAMALVNNGQEPVAAICDYNMPGKTGLTLAVELRSRCPDIPVLLLSGGIANDEINEALESGLLWAYVNKPWSLQWIKAAIGAMVRGAPPPPREL